ncbi:MAG: fasciclin domain-containing protein [Cytophagaceae bacterium]|nr:fasciclin domain-containing protein [Cytophagaceae bacterium]
MKNTLNWGLGLSLALGTMVGLGSCNNDDDDQTGLGNTVNDILTTNAGFSYFRAAVERAGWNDSLRNGNFTLFAPSDSAFMRAGFTSTSRFGGYSADSLRRILRYHIVPTRLALTDITTANNTETTTLGGSRIYVTKTSIGSVFVNGNRVRGTEISASNGIIHTIDGVLTPPVGNLSQAFARDTTYSFLVAAATRAGRGSAALTAALTGTTPYTVFAPTNAAFRAAGYGSLVAINRADSTVLGRILLYHVIPGRVFSSDFINGSVTTVGGGTFNVGLLGGNVSVTGTGNGTNAARVTRSNLLTSNGIIHTIDRLLLPTQ